MTVRMTSDHPSGPDAAGREAGAQGRGPGVRAPKGAVLYGHDKNDDGDSDGGSGTTQPQDGDHWEDEDD